MERCVSHVPTTRQQYTDLSYEGNDAPVPITATTSISKVLLRDSTISPELGFLLDHPQEAASSKRPGVGWRSWRSVPLRLSWTMTLTMMASGGLLLLEGA
jgi:hypothetical protein